MKTSRREASPLRSLLRPFTIIAQDPSICIAGRPLFAQVRIPAERLSPGPWGYRFQVIDYDASTASYYAPWHDHAADEDEFRDPFHERAQSSPDALLEDPEFHQCNAYAIAMRILARFEFALGRRVSWQFDTHQLKIVPHAFAEPNAYYSRTDESLLFGYFPGKDRMVFSCLSHDVVAHETTHALIDGLREGFLEPSSPDQAAFHEGFSDIVALLSVLALPEIVDGVFHLKAGKNTKTQHGRRLINGRILTIGALRESVLLSLAEEMGQEISGIRGDPLRSSAKLLPDASLLEQAEFQEAHRRGEILVAAILTAFLQVVVERIRGLSAESFEGDASQPPVWLDRARVVEEIAKAADHLLTIAIRALDYTMPVHLTFGDFLSSMLTADHELVGDDSQYRYRHCLLKSFAGFGIEPSSSGQLSGKWNPAPDTKQLKYDGIHFQAMQRDRDEVFRFLWENRGPLHITDDVYTRVLSVRPCVRIGPDGFFLHETVAEYLQLARMSPAELKRVGIRTPRKLS
ncbi:MAG: hypothetical protein KDA96_27220, partial [Planctomycetaceae bacterium]|nr:hypothetical protein [Planctomycetaceae bacterium]